MGFFSTPSESSDAGAAAPQPNGPAAGAPSMPESIEAFAARYEQAVAASPALAQPADPLADALFSEELVRDLAGIPYSLAELSTGHNHWALSDKERSALGKVGSLYLRHRVKLDPAKAIDFFFWGTLFAFTLPRGIREIKLIVEESKRKAAKQPAKEPSPDAPIPQN